MAGYRDLFAGNNVEELASKHKAGFDLIPPGWTKLVFVKEEIGISKNNKKKVVWTFETSEGLKIEKHFVLDDSCEQWMRDRSMSEMSNIIVAMGFKTFPEANHLYGRSIEGKIYHRPYDKSEENKDKITHDMKEYRPCQDAPKPKSNSASGW